MDAEVAIIGLGTAGAATAAACAEVGLKVVGFDRLPLDRTGARWCNGVPAWAFDAAGFDRPVGEELAADEHTPYHLVAGWDGPRVTTPSMLDVDMRHLGSRLLNLARERGADLRGDQKVLGFDGTTLDTVSGPIRARVFVDAGGLVGPKLDDRPTIPPEDLCVAAQQVHEVADEAAAEDWFRARHAAPGEIVCFAGVAGGYSILNARLHDGHVSVLTGTLPALGNLPGTTLMQNFLADNPWIGPKIFGGSRAIPLGLPHARIGAGNVARIGDSAGMVHAAHGSGIAQQLLAARLLADTLASGGTPADYNVAWHRQYGGVLAGADVFRRFSQTLPLGDLARLIEGGAMNPEMMKDTLTQKPVRPALSGLAKAARGLVKAPDIARRMLPILGRMKAMELHERRYPSDPAKVERWARRRQRIAG